MDNLKNMITNYFIGGRKMKKLLLVGGSILAVILMIMGSQTSVVGYQTIRTYNGGFIEERLNQKELLFQTIIDLANNKEIQKIVLTYNIFQLGFFPPIIKTTFKFPDVTKRQLQFIYGLGSILKGSINKANSINRINQHWVLSKVDLSTISKTIKENAKFSKEEINYPLWTAIAQKKKLISMA